MTESSQAWMVTAGTNILGSCSHLEDAQAYLRWVTSPEGFSRLFSDDTDPRDADIRLAYVPDMRFWIHKNYPETEATR